MLASSSSTRSSTVTTPHRNSVERFSPPCSSPPTLWEHRPEYQTEGRGSVGAQGPLECWDFKRRQHIRHVHHREKNTNDLEAYILKAEHWKHDSSRSSAGVNPRSAHSRHPEAAVVARWYRRQNRTEAKHRVGSTFHLFYACNRIPNKPVIKDAEDTSLSRTKRLRNYFRGNTTSGTWRWIEGDRGRQGPTWVELLHQRRHCVCDGVCSHQQVIPEVSRHTWGGGEAFSVDMLFFFKW